MTRRSHMLVCHTCSLWCRLLGRVGRGDLHDILVAPEKLGLQGTFKLSTVALHSAAAVAVSFAYY